MNHNLSGRVALVTGGSRGLGAEICGHFGACGARVAVNYLADGEGAQRVVDAVEQAGGLAAAFRADVTDETDVARLVQDVQERFGLIDILVLNATGPQPTIPIERMKWSDCLEQLAFFVKSPMLLTQQVVGQMKARRYGRIISIGSEVFETGAPEFSNYVQAKGAQLGWTRAVARELAPWQITVNLVAPGWIPGNRHASTPSQSIDDYAARVPMKRLGVPREVAEAVTFLASDGASFISGQKLSVNGANTLE